MAKTSLEALQCPKCGGAVELDSNQEYGVCKYCGAKVQNTNFKKIKGEVKIIGNPTVENFIKLAKRDYDDENYNEALEKYNKVLDIEPDNWEAVYKRGICITKTTTLGAFRMDDIVKGSKNALKIIEENKELKVNINQIKLDMAYDILMSCYEMFRFALNHYNEFWELENSASEMWNREAAVLNAAEYAATLIEGIPDDKIKTTISGETKKDVLLSAYDAIILCCVTICQTRSYKDLNSYPKTWIKDEYRNNYVQIYDKYSAKIKEIDPNKEIKKIQRTGNQGCYIATCVYGSYDCPEVWTLRRFRDNDLAKKWYGKLFIHIYYSISPTIVKLFGKSKWFKSIFKPSLDKLVKRLKEQGYESSPYDDQTW